MGNCHRCQERGETIPDKLYNRSITLDINSKKVHFKAPHPDQITYSIHSVGKTEVQASSCILEGVDPRGIKIKKCQDKVFISEHNSLLLSGVFDGHGKHGQDVITFCASFIIKYFLSHNFAEDTKEKLTSMIEDCDKALLSDSKIDCSTSGTTGVFVLITPDCYWTCSVGDSRSVLATLPKHPKAISQLNLNSAGSYKVPIFPLRVLKTVPITLDQKPNISYELERIIKSGGVVSQVTGNDGKKVGPYRIWVKNGSIPGLAMSRSLGDSIAKSVGVISKPIIFKMDMCPSRDQFIVIATDGVWDTMSNLEAAHFVDKYRLNCAKVPDYKKRSANERNCVAAELLCEEARFRWFGICSEEDVPIDDISAVVLEIVYKGESRKVINRKGITTEQMLDILEDKQEVIRINKRFDIKRGSNATIEEEDEEDDEES